MTEGTAEVAAAVGFPLIPGMIWLAGHRDSCMVSQAPLARLGRFFRAVDAHSSLGCSGTSAGPAARWGLRGFVDHPCAVAHHSPPWTDVALVGKRLRCGD